MVSVSPNVTLTEIDKSIITINPSNNIAMFVGEFEKGPINEPVFIRSTLQYKQIFGRPNKFNNSQWYQVFNYLQYASGIWVCRSAGDLQYKASDNGNIVNSPGEWGNIMSISIFSKDEWFGNLELQQIFSEAEIEDFLIIIYRDNKIVETHCINSIDEFNSFYFEKINLELGTYHMSGGYTDRPYARHYNESYYLFTKEEYDIDIVIANDTINEIAIEFAEYRRDCIVFMGLPQYIVNYIIANNKILTTTDGLIILLGDPNAGFEINKDNEKILEYVKNLQKSDYVFFTIGLKVILDKFTGKNVLVNINGDIAGLKAKASLNSPWDVGAGVEKGKIKNFLRTKYILDEDFSKSLYKNGVNVLKKDTLMTQKMFLDTPKSINKLNIRNTLNYLERTCEKQIKRFIFELNNKNVRYQIMSEIKRVLDDVLNSRGIEAGKVVVKPGENEQTININIYIKFYFLTEFVNINVTNVGTEIFSNIIVK